MVVEEVISEQVQEESLDTFFKKASEIKTTAKLKILVWGEQGLGKSFFALSFPEPVYVLCTEPQAVSPLLVHFPDKDIRIVELADEYTDAPVKKQTGKADDSVGANDPEVFLRKFEKGVNLLKDIQEGTIVLDSVTDLWDNFVAWIEYNADKYTQSGQMMRTEWGKVNNKYKNLLNKLQSRPVHFVMTARSENVYAEGGRETTQKKMSGQKKTPYIPHVIMQIKKQPKPKVENGKVVSTTVSTVGVIEKARGFDESALGVTIERPTFDKLKEAIGDKGSTEMFS